MSEPAGTVYRVRDADVSWRAAGPEVVVLNTSTSVYFGLGGSGALLWPHLAEGATAADLIAVLTADAPVETGRAAADLDAFLGTLMAHQLIQRS